MKKRKKLKIFIIVILSLMITITAAALDINGIVKTAASPNMYTMGDIDNVPEADCILVLGAKVWSDERLSLTLKDRVDYALKLYHAGKADKLLLSGDHGTKGYDEVNAMRHYAMEQGVPAENIFLDHAGFSTYESLYRARNVFMCESVVIVTQRFHLYRAVYIAKKFGLAVSGVNSDPRRYANEMQNEVREFFARVKDFFYVNVFAPVPKHLGKAVPISGDGRVTHDQL